jgi:hypothetical protein
MAQTDSRAGFRLPWSSERSTTESSDAQLTEGEADPSNGWATAEAAATAADGLPTETDTDRTGDTAVDDTATTAEGDTVNETEGALETTEAPATPEPSVAAPRKQSKFLADLTKAMQAAAEDARNASLAQFQADAKSHVEQIHERSATEAAGLRRAADDDVAAVREWSKAEIARIREETENRITTRKGRLESEIEGHAAQIEREIERVNGHVSAFEHEMADFFERLLAENDPTRFATMAERLPEPPPFAEMGAAPPVGATNMTVADAPAELDEAVADDAVATGEPPTAQITPAEAEAAEVDTSLDAEPAAETATDESMTDERELSVDVPADFEIDRESAFAAIQAAAEAAASAEVATDAAERAEAVADIAIEIVGAHDEDGDERDVAATDFDAAEAEARASANASGDGDEIPVIGDEALAARLADLMPAGSENGSTETQTTHVVVTGLVSVASIASFKRHLGRLVGVKSVGVSSGPDGEFLFAVNHATDIVLRDAIPSLPSFQARVTGTGDGTLNVNAHDPESDH